MNAEEKAAIEAIRARHAAATEGPWHKVQSVDEYGKPLEYSYYIPEVEAGGDMLEADADFITNAHADIPRLLAIIEGLEKALAEARTIDAAMVERAAVAMYGDDSPTDCVGPHVLGHWDFREKERGVYSRAALVALKAALNKDS